MEFLLIWVLSGHLVDSGLRYRDAGECFAAAQNLGGDLKYAGVTPPKFTCIPLKQGYELEIYMQPAQNGSRFPF